VDSGQPAFGNGLACSRRSATALLLRWRYISANEEDQVGALIDKKEKKGLVGTEYERRRWRRDSAPGYHYIHHYSSCGSGFRPLLVNVEVGLMDDLLDLQSYRARYFAWVWLASHA
jgi:hypothetical protein